MGRKAKQKTRLQSDNAREKLVIKAMVYFQNYGTDLTMSKLAKNLAISKTTIYNHFKTKDELVHEAVKFKLSIINDYESVLNDTTLTYIERYRKSMLFFCVQVFDVSSVFLNDIKDEFPTSWKLIERFQYKVFLNLTAYYEDGIQKGIFKEASARLLTMNDQYFFAFLSDQDFLKKNDISVLTAFKNHYETKFFGILNPDQTRSF